MFNLLTLFATPLVASLAVFLFPLRRFAILLSLLPLVMLLSHHWISSEIDFLWVPALSIHFHLQVDALSLLFLYLTAVITPIALLKAPCSRPLYSLGLLLQGLLIGFFTAKDLFVFTLFWEAMLLPLYFIINFWGGPKKQTDLWQ